MTDLNLEQFFANTARMKTEVEKDSELITRIKEILATGHATDFGGDALYTPLQPERLGLKRRGLMGKIELTMMADLYVPGFPMSPFGVLIGDDLEPSVQKVAYLVQDLGEVQGNLNPWDELLESLEIRKVRDHIKAKGYKALDIERAFGRTEQGIVFHDIDAAWVYGALEIKKGVREGEGEFARLHAIYERLKSPEYKLNLE